MNFLAISGSTRRASTNTALLDTISQLAAPATNIAVLNILQQLPIFSPDLEGAATQVDVRKLIDLVRQTDGIIISSPEYVHAIPGGLKNAIDWLVSGDAIIDKPMVLVHASHRGEDMLSALRLVLGTITANFNEQLFLSFPLVSKSPSEIGAYLRTDANTRQIRAFISDFEAYARLST
ncbi:MAG: FMN reductase [Sneathiella sp.]|nr:MAG: FMN reductase [Sneathiella sp.]